MTTETSATWPVRLAAIDIGSNAIRCMVAEATPAGDLRDLLEERATVRLGTSVFREGSIDGETMDAAVAALKGFQSQLKDLKVYQTRAVATSAVREASNRSRFLERILKETGLRVDVVSGAEEARLVYAAVRRRIKMDGSWITMDLGGGSVEVSLVDGDGLVWSESHPMGTVRLLEEFRAMEGEPERFRRLIQETVETLRLPGNRRSRKIAGLAATGGNIEELARLAGLRDPDTKVSEMPLKDLSKTIDRLAKLDAKERVKELGLRPDRADVILPAAYVYEHVAHLAGVDRIHVPHVGLKEGIVYDLVEQLVEATGATPGRAGKYASKVQDGALALGRRFDLEQAHGLHVARLALSMFDQLATLHNLGTADRAILHAAAILHDVGRFVGDKKHHKHSYYLISESELPGFSEPEVELVAQVARYHRRSEPKPSHAPYAALSLADQARVMRLSGILRVADALDREHCQAVRKVKCLREPKLLRLRLTGEGDMELEQWAVQQKGGLFTTVYGLELETQKEEST